MSLVSPVVNGNSGGGGSSVSSVTEISIAELRDIAARQQARIDAQLNDLRHRQLALSRLRKDGGVGSRDAGLAAAVEDRDARLSRLRLQRRQLEEYRLVNAQLAAQLAQAREAYQRRTEELTALDHRVEVLRQLALAQQQQQPTSQFQRFSPSQQQQQLQSKSHPTLPSPDSRLARLREAVLQRRHQSEQLRLKAAAAAAAASNTTNTALPSSAADGETAVLAERPPSPPTQWHRRHAPRHVIIASTCRRSGQLPAEAAAATAQRYREAARLAYEAAAAREQQERQQQQQQQQAAAVSLSSDGIEDLIRREASAQPEEKRRSLVVVQDPPGAPIGWRAPIAKPDDDETNLTAALESPVPDGSAAAGTTHSNADKLADKQASPDESSAAVDSAAKALSPLSVAGNKIQPAAPTQPDKKLSKADRSVTFAPLTVLLDAAMEGDPDQIRACAAASVDLSAGNEEGITAMHNAVCAGHTECVRLLISLGADVNSPDIDGWTPLHCSVSCNHLALTQLLVKSGAAVYCATRADFETPLALCQEGGSVERFLRDEADKLGVENGGLVYAVHDFQPSPAAADELTLKRGSQLTVLRRSDQDEPDWFWCSDRQAAAEGYAPKSLLSLYPPGSVGLVDESA